jgi:hypothetical protein
MGRTPHPRAGIHARNLLRPPRAEAAKDSRDSQPLRRESESKMLSSRAMFNPPRLASHTPYVPFIAVAGMFADGDIVVAGHMTTKDTSNTDTIVLRLKKSVAP